MYSFVKKHEIWLMTGFGILWIPVSALGCLANNYPAHAYGLRIAAAILFVPWLLSSGLIYWKARYDSKHLFDDIRR